MTNDIPSLYLAVRCARAADDKQASDIVVLPVGDVLAITEYFVVASASNPRQVRAITDAVLVTVREQTGRGPLRSEGVGEQQWVLVDYGDVVVHVFSEEQRRFYEIERLYKDVQAVDWAGVELS
ncbi:MAG: ribosome silencing factor [Actinomycetota bacterium]